MYKEKNFPLKNVVSYETFDYHLKIDNGHQLV